MMIFPKLGLILGTAVTCPLRIDSQYLPIQGAYGWLVTFRRFEMHLCWPTEPQQAEQYFHIAFREAKLRYRCQQWEAPELQELQEAPETQEAEVSTL